MVADYSCGGFHIRRSFTATDGGGSMQQHRALKPTAIGFTILY